MITPTKKRPAIPKPVPSFRARKLAVKMEFALCEGNKERFIDLAKQGIRAFHLSPKAWEEDRAEGEKINQAQQTRLVDIDPRIGGMLARRAKCKTVADLASRRRSEIAGVRGFGMVYVEWCDGVLKKRGLGWMREDGE